MVYLSIEYFLSTFLKFEHLWRDSWLCHRPVVLHQRFRELLILINDVFTLRVSVVYVGSVIFSINIFRLLLYFLSYHFRFVCIIYCYKQRLICYIFNILNFELIDHLNLLVILVKLLIDFTYMKSPLLKKLGLDEPVA